MILSSALKPLRYTVPMKLALGSVVVVGIDIVLDGKRASNVRAVVLQDSDMSLLGQTYRRQIDTVKISDDMMTLE